MNQFEFSQKTKQKIKQNKQKTNKKQTKNKTKTCSVFDPQRNVSANHQTVIRKPS